MQDASWPLSRELLAHLPKSSAAPSAALEAPLQEALAQARARWPPLELMTGRFLSHLAETLGDAAADEASLAAALRQRCLVDLYLACACADGVPAAIQAFLHEHLARVPTFVARLKLSNAQVEDVQLTLQERLLVGPPGGAPRIATYHGQGNLQTFVRVAALRLGLNQLRRENPGSDPGSIPPGIVPPSAETDLLLNRYREEFQAAVKAAFQGLDRDRRSVLQLYYVDRLNTRDIARMFQVNPTTASRWVAEARAHIGQEVRRVLRDRLQVSDAQLQSLYQAVRSHLNLSIRTALGGGSQT